MRRPAPIALLFPLMSIAAAASGTDRAQQLQQQAQLLRALSSAIQVDQSLLSAASDTLEERRGVFDLTAEELRDAEARHAAAQRKLQAARRFESRHFSDLKGLYKTDPKAAASIAELEAAQDALATERERVLNPVRATGEHAAAVREREAVRAELETAHASGTASQGLISALAGKLLDRTNAVAAIENDALQGDAAYRAADARVTEARAQYGEIRRQIDDRIRVDETRIAAGEAVDRARAEASAAEKELLRQRRTAAAARSAYENANASHQLIQRRLFSNQRLLQSYGQTGAVIIRDETTR